MGYSSLHCHTAKGSNIRLLDSTIRINDLVRKAVEYGFNGIAITDHESVSAHIEALKIRDEIQHNVPDFKVMLGNEIYLIDESEYKTASKFYHFILIAKDAEGYQQIKTLSSRAWARSYKKGKMYRSPTFYQDIEEVIGDNKGHLIAASACLGGQIATDILSRNQTNINQFIPWCIKMFGKDNFFLEMQDSDSPEQQEVNNFIIKLSDFFDIKYIVTSDVHYLNAEDAPVHSAFLNSKEEKERETESFYKYTYLKSQDEMKRIMSYLPVEIVEQAMENTQLIYDMVENFDIRHSTIVPEIKIKNPNFIIDEILTSCPKEYIQKFVHSEYIQDRYWAYNIAKGLREKTVGKPVNLEVWLNRIEEEMEVVWKISDGLQQRLSAYFNLVQKIIDVIWEVTMVMCGRGSSPGFLTNYLIGITQFNPLDYNLPSWRFLNLERWDMPDIDIDIDGLKTDEAVELLRKEFGDDCVLNTLTFHTETLKSAILTAARGHGLSSDEAQVLSSMVPVERGKVASLKECLGEVDDVDPVPGFKDALESAGILETVKQIEGLVSGAGVHASSVYIFSNGYLEHNSLMKAPNGALITAYNMHDSDDMGALKFDLLKTDATTKITECLNLLLSDNVIQWQGSLRATYNKYIHPDVVDFNDKKVWENIQQARVPNLFQFETMVGSVAIQKVKPSSILELSLCNDGMRLQGTLNGLTPVERFAKFKNNIDLWYKEMKNFGLTVEEIKVLEEYALPTYGNSINQETLMRILMDKNISKFTLGEANNARKVLAKKLVHKVEELKNQYYEKGMSSDPEKGLYPARKEFLDYVYNFFIQPQLGYSFSTVHSHAYSIIGVQEAWLYTHYNPLYWACACMSVNAGSTSDNIEDFGDEEDEEDVLEPYEIQEQEMLGDTKKKKAAVTNYGKVAKAIGDIQANGIKVELPNINTAQKNFAPNIETNSIIYGMYAISGMNNDTIFSIISNRPYLSLEDFIERVPLTNVQMISLIKAGAFDELEKTHRYHIMDKYLDINARKQKTKKNKMTMANYPKALELNIIPDRFHDCNRAYYFKKWIDEHSIVKGADGKDIYRLIDNDEKKFFCQYIEKLLTNGKDYDIIPNGYMIKINAFKKAYEQLIAPLKEWFNSEEAINIMYEGEVNAIKKEWNDKYCRGSISKWEMDSLSCYYSGHELAKVNNGYYNIVDFNTLPVLPVEVSKSVNPKTGVEYSNYNVVRIAGTVLNADKAKHIVTLLTVYGVVDVKFYKMAFIYYNKRISRIGENGKKTVIEGSWFTRGNQLLITGLRKENMFSPRRDYKKGYTTTVQLITGVNEGKLVLKSNREKGE